MVETEVAVFNLQRSQPPVRAQMRVWRHPSSDELAIRDHVANLNFILNGCNPGGVVFDLRGVTEVPLGDWPAIGCDCRTARALRRTPWYDRRAVNVYYHGEARASARCCRDGDIIFLGPRSPLGRLAHEAGHALGLRGDDDGSGLRYDDGHTDSISVDNPFTPWNLMWRANATLRSHLTLGQIAWIHGSERSVLARLGLATPAAELPCWADDHPDRTPREESSTIEEALAARYEQILSYWDSGRRPEGRPGSESVEAFVRLHKR